MDSIGVSRLGSEQTIEVLNTLLSDELMLQMKTRNFHWNVTGPHFFPLHSLFEKQYDELADISDEIAERCRQLGGNAIGTLKEVLAISSIGERPGQFPTDVEMVDELAMDHERIIEEIQRHLEAIGNENKDLGTQDLLVDVMKKHQKTAWMLRAHLEGLDEISEEDE